QATPSAICAGQCAALSATPGSGGDVVEWSTGSCGGAIVADPSQVCPTVTTTYYARTKNTANGCPSSTCCTVTIAVNSSSSPGNPAPGNGAGGIAINTQLCWSAASMSLGPPRTDQEMQILGAAAQADDPQAAGGPPTISPYTAETIQSLTGTVQILAFNGHSDNSA